MPHPDGGSGENFKPIHSFDEIYKLISNNCFEFISTTGEKISAFRGKTRDGSETIVFQGEKTRHGNVCRSCWGFRINCSGTRVGQCSEAIDKMTAYPSAEPDTIDKPGPVNQSPLCPEKMTYSHFQHRHNFAVWCAARAVQRKFAKTPILKKALENCGISEFVRENGGKGILQEKFDELHVQWCEAIMKTWEQENVKGASYGRAAKLVAVYLKSMIVVQNDGNRFADVAHPPIDRILLQKISKDKTVTHAHKPDWKAIAWTALDKAAYSNLIADFKQVMRGKPFWAIEKYWTVNESD